MILLLSNVKEAKIGSIENILTRARQIKDLS